MDKIFEQRVESILKILADSTRREIVKLISETPMNPKDLAEKLKISRPAVEKHLKLLKLNYLCELTVEPFPTPHYVYFITDIGLMLLDSITTACLQYFQSLEGIIESELDQIERNFVLGLITRNEYDSKRNQLLIKRNELESLQLTRIWVEEAKKVVEEHTIKRTSEEMQ
ncbi:ArsR/SmtB family transcription factor [Candidatus Hodarchaeum mangrovi]